MLTQPRPVAFVKEAPNGGLKSTLETPTVTLIFTKTGNAPLVSLNLTARFFPPETGTSKEKPAERRAVTRSGLLTPQLRRFATAALRAVVVMASTGLRMKGCYV